MRLHECRLLLTSMLLSLCAMLISPVARGASDAATPLSSPWGQRSYTITLEQLAPLTKLDLLGVEDRKGVYFGLRDDERVKRLRMELAYSYSSALIDSLSHLNIVLNGEVVDTIVLTRQDQGRPLQHHSELPVALLRRHNRLEVQLIAHYTLGCENPLHPDLWAHIDMGSRLLLDVDPIALPDDLKLLPAPFFDAHDVRRVDVSFVLPNPNDDKLQAAGVLASWFGALAGYRGTRYTADTTRLPERGHAVVVMAAADALTGIALPRISGPSLLMTSNPNDASSKVLVVTGRNADEIRTAVTGLVLGGSALSGQVALLERVQMQPRKPYDAPNWIPVDRPVELGELLSPDKFTAAGRDPWPIEMRLRVPPDLSRWRADSVPLDLRYRYVRYGMPVDSTLEVLVNQERIKRYDLHDESEGALGRTVFKDTGIVHERVRIPLHSFASDANLQFKFRYEQTPESECTGTLVDTRRSAIDPESTIDFSGLLHHLAMPDLAAFRSAGFPFTRMADLSESVVVLPPSSGPSTVAGFLNLMGGIGEATAYPAVALTVTTRPDPENLKDKDILLIGTGESNGLLAEWSKHLPVNEAAAPTEASFWSVSGFLDRLSNGLGASASVVTTAAAPGGTLMAGFESPITPKRSVLVFKASTDASLLQAVDLMADHRSAGLDIQGSSVQIRDGQVTRLSDEKTYYVGELGPFRAMQWFFSHRPMVLVGLYMLGALLMGVLFYLSLRARAQRRLRSDEQ